VPTFRRLSAEELSTSNRHRTHVDLTPYLDFLREIDSGEGGELAVGEGESQRAEKRRLTTAAKQLNRTIRYRRGSKDLIRFELQ